MLQDQVFLEREGDRWFERNQSVLVNHEKFDWATHLINLIENKSKIQTIAELGCSTGWRLHNLRQSFPDAKIVGFDASLEAIKAGQALYPNLELCQGTLAQNPLQEEFDLVIVAGVLCVVDRKLIAQSIAEIDRVTKDGGYLLLGDFLPDFPQRRHWHHCPNEAVYTYKQDYSKIFESLGTYKLMSSITFNADQPVQLSLQACDSTTRYSFALLQKSLSNFYPQLP